ncbi:MAG TPA: hypothetical protein QGH10_26995 [Armatimonadota bacterium]|nr:hypothetical protein [Armatimonadota bacterium]
MLDYLQTAILKLMGEQPLMMGLWVGFASMLILLRARVHRFRKMGEFRLFGTSAIMGVTIPLATWAMARFIVTQLHGPVGQVILVLTVPVIIILVFVLTVTLVQKFIGADAETAMQLSWPITLVTYVVPLALCFLLSLFQDRWLATGETTYY